MDDTSRRWIAQHPFLEGVAAFHDAVEAAVAKAALPTVALPSGDGWKEDLAKGLPLLLSEKAGLSTAPALGPARTDAQFASAPPAVPSAVMTGLARDSRATISRAGSVRPRSLPARR